MPTPREAGKGICFPLQVMGREVVVAVTNGRFDGSTERSTKGFDRAQPRASRRGLAEVFGTWERIFQGQAERLARESRRPVAEAGAGQDYRRVVAIRDVP